jgi:hypothetical protein
MSGKPELGGQTVVVIGATSEGNRRRPVAGCAVGEARSWFSTGAVEATVCYTGELGYEAQW